MNMQTQPASNSAARKAVIREVSDAILPLEGQMAVLRDKIKEHKVRLKEHGIRAVVFNNAHSVRKLDDEEKRESYVQEYAEAFDALSIGQQLDWLVVQERRQADERRDAEALRQAIDAAGFDGFEKGRAGKARECPHPPGTPHEQAWLTSFDEAQAANRAALAGAGAPAP